MIRYIRLALGLVLDAAGLPRFWTGSASSPVTHRTYGMLCTRGRGWPSKVNCWTGKNVSLSFSAY